MSDTERRARAEELEEEVCELETSYSCGSSYEHLALPYAERVARIQTALREARAEGYAAALRDAERIINKYLPAQEIPHTPTGGLDDEGYRVNGVQNLRNWILVELGALAGDTKEKA